MKIIRMVTPPEIFSNILMMKKTFDYIFTSFSDRDIQTIKL